MKLLTKLFIGTAIIVVPGGMIASGLYYAHRRNEQRLVSKDDTDSTSEVKK